MEDQRMPDEVLELFFAYLDLKSLARACGVCQRWKGIIDSNPPPAPSKENTYTTMYSDKKNGLLPDRIQ